MRRAAPRTVAGAMAALTDSLAPPTLLTEVQRRWTQAAGDAIAREAQPTAERGGVVTVTCSSSVWAQELDLLSRELLERLNAALGRPAITALRCQAAPTTRWAPNHR